jgi:hypothetical protein
MGAKVRTSALAMVKVVSGALLGMVDGSRDISLHLKDVLRRREEKRRGC